MFSKQPKDTFIETCRVEIDLVSKHSPLREHKGVRIYKYSPDTVLLQIWGLRASTPMQGNATLNKEQLTQLRDAATALLAFL